MAARSRTKTPWLLIFLLVLLGFFVLIFALPSLKTQVSTGTQTASEGQCLPGGQGFDEQQEAFTLAQTAEQYRAAYPFRGNYGLGSYTICYGDGTQQRVQSPVIPGYNNKSGQGRLNDTHSEQGVFTWLGDELEALTIDQSRVAAIYAVIFSQVIVCDPCQQDMITWQRTLREKARTNNLYLSIWDIRPRSKSSIIPATYPAGTGTPVAIEDLRKVPIRFVL
jgi:hypothetical protein